LQVCFRVLGLLLVASFELLLRIVFFNVDRLRVSDIASEVLATLVCLVGLSLRGSVVIELHVGVMISLVTAFGDLLAGEVHLALYHSGL
jgi:hypothetical protein